MNASRTRLVAVIVIVIAFVALATFALLGRAYRPGRDGVGVPTAFGARIAQSVAAVAPVEAVPTTAADVTPAPTNTATAAAPAPAAPAPSAAPTEPPSTNGLAPCPLGLAVPTQQAGLANLVGLVPLFGPFSPEAFAMVPAFEPGFPLFGPLIVAGGEQLDANADGVGALVGVVHPLQQAGFDALSPLYAPYRQQVLDGETAVANTVKPGVAAFASLPGASCFPAALALAF
ncbi:MAG TPA: hypothetical protein VFB78_08205 [Acidimicrobiales bacterium]|nr:hypothetical protein [Acidimicrobiales bacterium]